MSPSAQEVLAQIPELLQRSDAAALVGLSEHDDKAIRKAARKAVHVLRSRGVEIPAAGKSWSPGASEASEVGSAASAMVDVGSTPGLVRIYVAEPSKSERSFLFAAVLTAFDQLAGFNAYVQTEGQRARLLRDWNRQGEGRAVPVAWAKARIRWARDQSLARGIAVPEDVNGSLIHLGESPRERPASFLAGTLAEVAEPDTDKVLSSVAAGSWPPVLEVEPLLKRVTEAHPEITQETPEADRMAALLEGAAGDEAVREALSGPIANLLDDSAIGLWLAGNDDLAAHARAMAQALRGDAPETLPWVARLIGLQIAATVAYQQMQQQQQRMRGA